MTFAYWMLIAAAMMPYLTIALAKSAGGNSGTIQPTEKDDAGRSYRSTASRSGDFHESPAYPLNHQPNCLTEIRLLGSVEWLQPNPTEDPR
jgi:hypothetical protein